jgi:predicted dehydrogenase
MFRRHSGEAGIAIIVLPHHLYPEAVEAAAEAGLHILKEKPFARDLADARRMAAVLQRTNRVYMTAAQNAFSPAQQQARTLVRQGAIGTIYLAEGTILYSWNPDGQNWRWRGRRALSGGTAILDAGWHILESVSAMKGRPQRVYATTGSMSACPGGDYDTDDKGVLVLEYADGSIASIVTCHVALPRRFEVLLHGTRGNLEVQPDRLVQYDRRITIQVSDLPAPADLRAAQLDHFLACVLHGEEPLCGLQRSLELQMIVEAAYRSASEGRPVALDELAGTL